MEAEDLMPRHLLGVVTIAGTALALAGCATTGVSSHVRSGLDFTKYSTFEWGTPDPFPVGDPRLDKNPIFLDYVYGAIEKQMVAKGYERTGTNRPDLLIHFHANIDRRLNVKASDARRGYCLDDSCRAGVEEYEAGTLIVDVIDRRTDRLIWRGWAQNSVEGVLEDRDRLVRLIENGVARMFVSLPPAR